MICCKDVFNHVLMCQMLIKVLTQLIKIKNLIGQMVTLLFAIINQFPIYKMG